MKPRVLKKQGPAALVAAALALTVLLPALALLPVSAEAATEAQLRQQIEQLEDSAADLKAQKKELENQLSAIRNDKSQALSAKGYLDRQVAALESEIANSEEQIALFDTLILRETENLAAAEQAQAERYDLFCQRVRAMEEGGVVSYLAVLTQARDFGDLIDQAMMISEIMEYDNGVMQLLEETRQQVADSKAALEVARADQEAVRLTQEAAKEELNVKVAEAAQVVRGIEEEEDEYAEALAQVKADEEEVDRLVARRQKELEEKIRSEQIQFDPGTGYYYPLPKNYTRISSPYGYRTHPVTGKIRSFHGGFDLPAPKNTHIYAVRGGVVSISTYNRSYGNYVVVQHDNGISTLYAHMNSRGVQEGDIVTQGQTIGYVGTTGSSTGNHLHFEIRENGTKMDPEKYYPNINFT